MMTSTKERARGRWHEILPALGIDRSFLTGRHRPCPMCGGRDRFRFIDRRGQHRDGMWICNQCQPSPKPAIELAIRFTGKPFAETAREIDNILGGRDAIPQASKIVTPLKSLHYEKIWNGGSSIRTGSVADLYLRHRGVGMDVYPHCLRSSEAAVYFDDETRLVSHHPALLAAITDPAGQHVSTHRTFLAPDGCGKANVAKQRMAIGPYGDGPTIRLTPVARRMGIAEGIETALSAAKLFRIPVWSVICAHGIETFEPPPGCEHLTIFADNDRHGVGQRAAEGLCRRLKIPTEIKMPDQSDTDWNDKLMETHR